MLLEHTLLPGLLVSSISLCKEHESWIKDWLTTICNEVEDGIVSSSNCVAGFISENLVYGKQRTDWLGIMEEFLENDESPLAYSEKYGKKLYKFNQWIQSPIHAIYARWWIEKNSDKPNINRVKLIESFIQQNGWIYNPTVSETSIKTRMRAELFMSLSMGVEILIRENSEKINKAQLVATAISFPSTGFVSSEYFRFRTLSILEEPGQMVTGVDEVLKKCYVGAGFADFSVEDKIDDYMGVAKRVSRDKAVFTPISTLHAIKLAENCQLDSEKIRTWKQEICSNLEKDPLDIPSLQMRDLEPNFGEGKTIYEVITASKLMQK